MQLFAALTQRRFALLWTGQTVSRLGDSLYRIALAWWVLEKTGSAAIMGTVLIFSFTPMLIFLLVGGVAVDRLPRRGVMLASDLLRSGVVALVGLLAWTGALEVWHIFLASTIFGFVDAFFQPAYVALVPEVTPAAALPSANSLTQLSGQLTGIAGPALGAFIVNFGGTPFAFLLDGLSFLISAGCLVLLSDLGSPQAAREPSRGIGHDLREGWSTVLAVPWLWVTIGIAALANITQAGPLAVALPFLVKDVLHADVGTLGLLYTVSSAGAVLASIWLGRATRLRHRGLLAYGAWGLGGLLIAAVGLGIPVAAVTIASFLMGGMFAVFGLVWTNTLQEMVPRERLGRVSSIDLLGSFAFLPVGYAVSGWATDQLGAALVFVIGGGLTAALVGLGLAHPGVRTLD